MPFISRIPTTRTKSVKRLTEFTNEGKKGLGTYEN